MFFKFDIYFSLIHYIIFTIFMSINFEFLYIFIFNSEEERGEIQLAGWSVAYSGIFFGGEGSTNSVGDRGQRERGSGSGSPLVRGSGGSCNLVHKKSHFI